MPRKYFEQVGADGFAKAPIGTGPWKVVNQKVKEQLELQAWGGYWNQGARPGVQNLIVPDVARYDLHSLRVTRVSSFVEKLNVDYRRRWRALTGATLIEAAWGMTETNTCDTFTTGQQCDDFDLTSQPVFVGLPVPGTEFKITSFEGGELLPLGSEGEIVVRSAWQLKSYWNKPEATAASMREGWFYTGDIGLLDEHGFLHFLGRHKEMLKVNGMSVFPAEIEALLGPGSGGGQLRRDRPSRRSSRRGAGRLRAGRPRSEARCSVSRGWRC